MSALLTKYRCQEEDNLHSENALLLAEAFGTEAEIAEAKRLLAEHDRLNQGSEEGNRFQAEMSRKYYRLLCGTDQPNAKP